MGNDLVKKSVLALWDYTIGKYDDFVDKWGNVCLAYEFDKVKIHINWVAN